MHHYVVSFYLLWTFAAPFASGCFCASLFAYLPPLREVVDEPIKVWSRVFDLDGERIFPRLFISPLVACYSFLFCWLSSFSIFACLRVSCASHTVRSAISSSYAVCDLALSAVSSIACFFLSCASPISIFS